MIEISIFHFEYEFDLFCVFGVEDRDCVSFQ